MLKNDWIGLLIGGILMLCISGVICGGFIHTVIMHPSSWKFIMFLAFSGASTLVTGVLMIFDCMKYRVREEIYRAIQEKKKDISEKDAEVEERDIEHMDKLASEVERLRPKHIEKSPSS